MSVRILAGDCRTMLATLPDASVQCCVTSPPYFNLRDYQTSHWEGGSPECKHELVDLMTPTRCPCGAFKVDRQIGLEQSPDAYVAELVYVFREVRRVLAEDGTLWLNLGDSYAGGPGNKPHTGLAAAAKASDGKHRERSGPRAQFSLPPKRLGDSKPKDLLGIPWMVAFALRADGWYLRSDVIWAKPNPMPESVQDRPTSAHEHVFLLSKRERYFWDAEAVAEPAEMAGKERVFGRQKTDTATAMGISKHTGNMVPGTRAVVADTRSLRNVWTIATQPYSGAHFATMPPDLAERCIKAGTSERGQCPHCAAPWARVVERGADYPEMPSRNGTRADPTSALSRAGVGVKKMSGQEQAAWRAAHPHRTAGWSPTCACPEHAPVPQTVLDPFGGAGTTGLVADRLNRNAILIELNPSYADLARDRLRGDCPMFAEVA